MGRKRKRLLHFISQAFQIYRQHFQKEGPPLSTGWPSKNRTFF